MLIGCYFKRPKAPVELLNPNITYFFVPIDPNNPDSEHVAEVTDSGHIGRLLSLPEGYYLSNANATAAAAAKQTVKPVVAVVPPAAVTPPAAPAASETQAAADANLANIVGDASAGVPPADALPPPDAVTVAVEKLRALNMRDYRVQIAAADPAVIRAVLVAEEACGDAARDTVIKYAREALAKLTG